MSTTSSQRPCRIGVLVIHGIGDENPYGTLDSFARGLYTYFENCGPARYDMAAEWKERGADPSHKQQSWTQAQICFEAKGAERADAPPITMAEYYWSPATKGRLKDLDVLTWLIRTALEPFRYLSENIHAMLESAQAKNRKKAQRAWDGTVIVAREILRLAFLYIPLLLVMIALGALLETVPSLPHVASQIDWKFPHDAVGAVAIVRLMVLYALSGYFLGFYKWRRFRVPGASAENRFGAFTLYFAALLFAAVVIVPIWITGSIPNPTAGLTTPHWDGDLQGPGARRRVDYRSAGRKGPG